MVRGKPSARLLIVGQAPGTKVHLSGVSFDDRSGDRLRDWMELDRATFCDEARLAILPIGLCYPGRNPRGGDLPPRPECVTLWHPRWLPLFPRVELTLLMGMYAQARYLAGRRRKTLSEPVAAWRDFGSAIIPLPHPSWRSIGWLKANPWFERTLVPELQSRVRTLTG